MFAIPRPQCSLKTEYNVIYFLRSCYIVCALCVRTLIFMTNYHSLSAILIVRMKSLIYMALFEGNLNSLARVTRQILWAFSFQRSPFFPIVTESHTLVNQMIKKKQEETRCRTYLMKDVFRHFSICLACQR